MVILSAAKNLAHCRDVACTSRSIAALKMTNRSAQSQHQARLRVRRCGGRCHLSGTADLRGALLVASLLDIVWDYHGGAAVILSRLFTC